MPTPPPMAWLCHDLKDLLVAVSAGNQPKQSDSLTPLSRVQTDPATVTTGGKTPLPAPVAWPPAHPPYGPGPQLAGSVTGPYYWWLGLGPTQFVLFAFPAKAFQMSSSGFTPCTDLLSGPSNILKRGGHDCMIDIKCVS